MITKNLKSLSLFLVIMVLMIGAIGAVSAVNQNAGYSDIKIGTYDDINVTESNAVDPGNTIKFTIVTDGKSSGSPEGATVPDNTTVVKGNTDITFAQAVYSDKGTTDTEVTTSGSSISYENGVYTGTLKLSAVTGLVNGKTYYVGVSVPADAQAIYPEGGDDGVYSVPSQKDTQDPKATVLYIPFTYISNYEVEIVDSIDTITYGGSLGYNGTIVINTATPLPANAVVDVVFTTKGESPVTAGTIQDVKIQNDNFTISTKEVGSEVLDAGNYTVVFQLWNDKSDGSRSSNPLAVSKEINLTVEGIKLTIVGLLNETSVAYDNPATLNLTVLNAKGQKFNDETPTIKIVAVNQNNGEETTIKTLTISEAYGEVQIVDNTANEDPLDVGSYIITVTATLENYDIDPITLTYTVNNAKANITATPNPLYISKATNIENGVITVDVVDNAGDSLENIALTEFTVVVRDANGVTQASEGLITTTINTGKLQITVTKSKVKEGYYAYISFERENYEVDSVQVPIYVRSASTLQVNETTVGDDFVVNYNYGAQNITAVVSLVSGDIKLNSTVNITDKKGNILGTVTVVNGAGNVSLSDLNLDAGKYTLTLKYVDVNDVYAPTTATISGTVYAIQSYVLTADNKTITYDTNSEQIIRFTLTDANNASKIADYTGNLAYTYINDTEEGTFKTVNITMTNGIATIPVSELEGLIYVDNHGEAIPIEYTFSVEGNYVSNAETVTVTIKLLNGAINAENVVVGNNSPVTIEGVVENATGGYVRVSLYPTDGEDESIYYEAIAKINDDGSFIVSFAKLPTGNYTAEISYVDYSADIPLDAVDDISINITVVGESPVPPTPSNVTYNTILVINDFSEVVGAGKSLTGKLTTEDGVAISGMHIQLTLTRNSNGASRTYTTTTDYNGEFQFPINLAVGEYIAKATFEGVTIPSTNVTYEASASEETPFYVLPENDTNVTNDTTVQIIPQDYVGTYGNTNNFTAKFLLNGSPIVGIPGIDITLTRVSSGASKTYTYFVTDYNGDIFMPIELAPGEYTAHIVFNSRTEPYIIDGAEADATITVNP